jgi:hypothetical protein
MRNLVLGAATLALAAITSAHSASADIEYPYCAKTRGGGGDGCTYSTVEQCRAFVSGTGGFCYDNPRYTPNVTTHTRAPRTRRSGLVRTRFVCEYDLRAKAARQRTVRETALCRSKC